MREPTQGNGDGVVSNDIANILQAARSGDIDLAYELAGVAVERGERDPAVFEIVAGWLAGHGQNNEAAAAIETLRALADGDPVLLVRVGLLLLRLRRPGAALTAFEAAIALEPDYARAHYERGVALGILGQIGEMRTAHERTIALEPRNADALASLALIAARAGDTAQTRNYASQSLGSRPDSGPAEAALAVADINDGKFADAQRRLDLLLTDARLANDTWIDIAISDAGDAFAQRNCFPQAFAAYTAVNERRRKRQLPAIGNLRAVDAVRHRTAYFNRSEPWRIGCGRTLSPVAGHVFLLGFMRSGTTLLETVLASNPAICAMDEREFLAAPARRFLFADETLDELAALDEPGLGIWCQAYWKAVEQAGADVAGRVFVNKMPFNSLRLPLLAKLFADARIILAIRDPRDVVLSCFRHRFDANQLTFEFLRLEDCARFYSATMEFMELCRSKLPLRICEHRYEDMIADFDTAVRAICEFIGVEWNEAMRDFVPASGVIAQRNQSAEQVRRGLYSSGIGQWRRFRAQLEPAIPILAPWIARFGYPAD
ncbi:MAG TPA: sulfotransferase [Rhizomicrobium sp.]|nr:sulfotransferase [Rhizomicrobium sp.]